MQTLSLEQRIKTFARLGGILLQAAGEEATGRAGDRATRGRGDGARKRQDDRALAARLLTAMPLSHRANPWFDEENVRHALRALGRVLTEETLRQWTDRYPQLKDYRGGREVVVIMAGNIPLVGFHDMLAVLITGHRLIARTSTRDAGLHRLTAEILTAVEPAFGSLIRFTRERPEQADAVIATGSDNTARYFEYYYRNVPAIIRRNRNSLAVLDGRENDEELAGLAEDIFRYYGLGCRSVSKLFVPEGYDLSRLLPFFHRHRQVTRLPAYRHNLDYQRAVFGMSGQSFLDAGNLLLTGDTALASPIGVLYYETYKDPSYISTYVGTYVDKIQCITAREGVFPGAIPLGTAQLPELWDYADGVDTIKFLTER